MSGASGKTASTIHVTPEAAKGGALAYVRDGDIVRLDPEAGALEIKVDPAALMARSPAICPPSAPGFGRELFALMRQAAGPADAGASICLELTGSAEREGVVIRDWEKRD